MNADDLAALAELTRRYRDGLEYLRMLARIPPEADVADVRELLEQLSQDVGQLVETVQIREMVSWRKGDNPPRHEPNRWLTSKRPLESKDVTSNVAVQRYDEHGRKIGEVRLGRG